jgi:nicotinic acetylcholine receptor
MALIPDLFISPGIENRTLSDEQKLLQKLMRGYDKSVRPVYNASTPVVVRLGITLTQIFDVVCLTLCNL